MGVVLGFTHPERKPRQPGESVPGAGSVPSRFFPSCKTTSDKDRSRSGGVGAGSARRAGSKFYRRVTAPDFGASSPR